jgi:hypothetical protein
MSDLIEQRTSALDALVSLHECAPDAVRELAGQLEQTAALHTALMPGMPCDECNVKRSAAALLRAVASLRDETGAIWRPRF